MTVALALSGTICLCCFERNPSTFESVEDDPGAGRRWTVTGNSHVRKVKDTVLEYCQSTLRTHAEEVNISGSCHQISSKKLKMNRLAIKFVPHDCHLRSNDEPIKQKSLAEGKNLNLRL